MLKIKDNVDLKELEKFGFEKHKLCYIKDTSKKSEDTEKITEIFVSEHTRIISVNQHMNRNFIIWNIDYELDIIYDLIQAELVEKVSE